MASPRQLTFGLVAAQLLPALPGALLGIPLGIGLFALANGGGAKAMTIPPTWWLTAAALVTLLVVGALTAIPARIGAIRD
jgi:putative ABC transport system permease protein